jgi:hypothetical protein
MDLEKGRGSKMVQGPSVNYGQDFPGFEHTFDGALIERPGSVLGREKKLLIPVKNSSGAIGVISVCKAW